MKDREVEIRQRAMAILGVSSTQVQGSLKTERDV
jgi:hypothetical protein